MQHDNSDDPFGFWDDGPTRPLKRVHAGTRAHGDTRMIPVVRHEPTRAVPEPPRPRNPLMTRVCVMLGVGLLLVPVALSLRSDKQEVRAAELKPVNTVVIGKMPPAPTDETLAPDTEAPTTIAATTTTAAPTTAARIEVAPTTVAATDPPPTTAAKVVKKTTPKTTTTPPPAPASTQTAAKAACSQTYTVVSGDAWSSIAARAKVSMSSLLAANGATIQTMLLPGKSICLPQGAVDPGPPTTKPPSTTQPATTQPKATVPATTHPPTTQPPATQPPATTAPATTQPPPPANTYSRAQVAQIIRDVWPDSLEDQAVAIATRESNLIPTAHNSCCYGLFQIYFNANKSWLAGIGITSPAQLYDPQVNASAALTLYNKNGWAPWALPTPATTTTTVSV